MTAIFAKSIHKLKVTSSLSPLYHNNIPDFVKKSRLRKSDTYNKIIRRSHSGSSCSLGRNIRVVAPSTAPAGCSCRRLRRSYGVNGWWMTIPCAVVVDVAQIPNKCIGGWSEGKRESTKSQTSVENRTCEGARRAEHGVFTAESNNLTDECKKRRQAPLILHDPAQ